MTNFDKIINYYKKFDEKNRLINDNSGRLEYEMTLKILEQYLPNNALILDLGGAAGVYTFPLSKKGYKMYLADLSEKLIEQAKKEKEQGSYDNVLSCEVVNAIDLSRYESEKFDVVLLFGPLYHLLEEKERIKCIKEVNRVLKEGGVVFASFIPYLSGSIAIVERYFKHPEQVDIENLKKVFEKGQFNNKVNNGFQEGYYPTSKEIENLFESHGFEKRKIVSIRGFGYEKEDKLYSLTNKEMFDEIMDLISSTADDAAIIETCGHAMYIGKKVKNV